MEVQSKKPLTTFTYQVVARGKVITAGSVAVPNRKYHVFKFPATFEMSPKLHVIVYRFDGNELVSAKSDISLKDDLKNYLKVKVSAQQAKPGQNVSIDILTNPRSYVGLLGVDQSVLLLKKNDGLTTSEALDELDSYQYQYHSENNMLQPTPRLSYRDAYWRDFHGSNVVLFTNAKQEGKRNRPLKPGCYGSKVISEFQFMIDLQTTITFTRRHISDLRDHLDSHKHHQLPVAFR